MTALEVDHPEELDLFANLPDALDPPVDFQKGLLEVQLARRIVRRFERTHVPPRLLEGLPTPLREQLQTSVREDTSPLSVEEAREHLDAQGLEDDRHEALADAIEDVHAAATSRAREVLAGRYDRKAVEAWLEPATGGAG